MLRPDEHDNLVARLYSSAAGDTPWATTLGNIADAFHSSTFVFNVIDVSGEVASSTNHGYSLEFSDAYYASEVFANDLRMKYFLGVPRGSVYYDNMLYDVEEMVRNRWCRASIDILKVEYQLGAVTALPN